MYFVAAFGLILIVLSLWMIISPNGWSRGILAFSRKSGFHTAEIVLRLLMGSGLIYFSNQTLHPQVFASLGYLFVAVGVGLIVAGPKRHCAFAVQSAEYRAIFRPAGFMSLLFGMFTIYSALRDRL